MRHPVSRLWRCAVRGTWQHGTVSVLRPCMRGLSSNAAKAKSYKKKLGGEEVYFGDKVVDESEKEELVRQVFSSVHRKYDLMNDIMSLGMHKLWKSYFVHKMAPGRYTSLIDVAGGTGDVTFEFLRHTNDLYGDESNVSATLIDINLDMLQVAVERADKYESELNADLSIEPGNAEDLVNVPSESMDIYSIAFGLRNCTKTEKVLSEAYRVLRPGGKFMCLELATVQAPVVSCMYDFFSFNAVPLMGQLVAKDWASYDYLVKSIRTFHSRDSLSELIRNAGFTIIGSGWEDLSLGVAAIHTGHKL